MSGGALDLDIDWCAYLQYQADIRKVRYTQISGTNQHPQSNSSTLNHNTITGIHGITKVRAASIVSMEVLCVCFVNTGARFLSLQTYKPIAIS